jgi:transglutaminase-like putative cysteine protease
VFAFDQTLYDVATIEASLTISGSVRLAGSGRGEDLSATVSYLPALHESITAQPLPASTYPLVFAWETVRTGSYAFSYQTTVTNDAVVARIRAPTPYPFTVPPELARYLQPQDITDTNQDIKDLAAQLVGSETDAVRAVTRLAVWVHENIAYNLSSITADASKSATWTLENRYGVCDELTSLFISLSREAGIPARFVSGLAYTNLPQFSSNWWAHGWAEVWLPDAGWVPVDVTYGQVLWTDATHIPFQRSLDAKSDAVSYSIRANDLDLLPSPLETSVDVTAREGVVRESLTLTLHPTYTRAGSSSANTLTATIRNDAPYPVVTDVTLARTQETVLHDNERQFVYLPASSVREVSWRVSLPRLESGYEYTFPFTIFATRGPNATTSVFASTRERVYPLPETPVEDATLPVRCDQPSRLYVGESATVRCTAPEGLVCVGQGACRARENTLSFIARTPGAFPTAVTVEAGQERGGTIVTFIVTEAPTPSITARVDNLVSIHDSGVLSFTVATETLTDVTVKVVGVRLDHEWTVERLDRKDFALQFPAQLLDAGENFLTLSVEGKDKNGATVTADYAIPVTLSVSRWERFQLALLHLFS